MSDRDNPRSLVEIMNDVLSTVREHYDSEYVYYIEKEYEDICFPITKEFRKELYDAILKEKDVMKQKQQEEFQKIDEMDKENLPFR